MSNIVMRYKSPFLQQEGCLDLTVWESCAFSGLKGIPTSHSPSSFKSGLFLEAVNSSVVPSLTYCRYCVITLLLAVFQTLLKMAAGLLIIAMCISHLPFIHYELLSRWILLLYAVFRESILLGIHKWTLFSIFGWNAHASTFRNGETVRYSVFGNRKAGRAEQPNACIVITLDNQAQWSTRWEGE